MNIGRYEVVRELGRGGMAIVYLAQDPYIKRQVAIKVLPRQFTFDPQFRARFQREAEVIAALEHPSIVPVHDFGEHDEQPFIVMRYMPGGSLAERMGGAPLPVSEVSAMLRRVGSALDYVHSQGLIHRDVKPGNILFDSQAGAFLSDFGIAKIAESSAAFTGTGIIGTPDYMSPEQARGEKVLDGRSDIYSLGIVLFQSLTGQLPFKADTPMGVALAHISAPAPDLSERRPDLPPEYATVVRRSLEKEPGNRFSTASQLAQSLERLATGEQPATPTGPDARTVIESPAAYAAPSISSTSSSPPKESSREMPPVSGVPGRRSTRRAWLAGGSLAAAILCVFAFLAGGLATGLLTNPFAIAQGPTAIASPTVEIVAQTPATATAGQPTVELPPVSAVEPVGLEATYIEYILDASGSMLETLQGKTRLEIAQQVLASRLQILPPRTQVGLRVYGHRVPFQQEADSCQDIELVVPIRPGGAQEIIAWLPDMQAQGMTPMSESIRQAAEDFTFEPGRKNFIVLISDGQETCGDDPATVVGYLNEIGIDFTIHVIGLDVDAHTRQQLSRIAEAAGGVYHDANSEEDLASALGEINEQILTAPLPEAVLAQAPSPSPPAPQPTPTGTAIPEPNAEISTEGTVAASSIYDATFSASLAVDGDPTTSWFSAGAGSGGITTYQWMGTQDDFIASIEIVSNREHLVVDFRTGYGFGSVTIQVLDQDGLVVFEEQAELPGTPDPDIQVHPNVVGRSVLLTFTGHEALDCGGIAELVIGAVR